VSFEVDRWCYWYVLVLITLALVIGGLGWLTARYAG
jgi:hypothetical protein